MSWEILEPLYRRHFDGLVRGLSKKLSRAEAEDIVQAAFVELKGKLDSGSVQNPKALLERIVEQRVKDHRRDSFYEVAAGLSPTPFVPPLSDSVKRGLMRNQLAAAIRELPPVEQSVFCLAELRGCDNGEIARLLGSTRSSVWTALHRARRRLQTLQHAM